MTDEEDKERIVRDQKSAEEWRLRNAEAIKSILKPVTPSGNSGVKVCGYCRNLTSRSKSIEYCMLCCKPIQKSLESDDDIRRSEENAMREHIANEPARKAIIEKMQNDPEWIKTQAWIKDRERKESAEKFFAWIKIIAILFGIGILASVLNLTGR